ncbi:MAG: pilus assembly protein N-terminal domain-containing protein [Holosporaceae bacterium]|jgi:pilus assembly protein CpaC|nr:pilus assembly protein N-terminal domain-containing protein [Holosporaceae bacterium]
MREKSFIIALGLLLAGLVDGRLVYAEANESTLNEDEPTEQLGENVESAIEQYDDNNADEIRRSDEKPKSRKPLNKERVNTERSGNNKEEAAKQPYEKVKTGEPPNVKASPTKQLDAKRKAISRAKETPKPDVAGVKPNQAEMDYAGVIVKEIELHSVNFIKLKEKASEIFIPNPKVADIEMLSDTSLYLTGLNPGVTLLVVHSEQGKIIANYQIRVTYPLREVKRALAEVYPEAEIDIISLEDSVVIRGKVDSPEMAAEAQELVGRIINNAKIINKLVIETSTQVLLKVKVAEVSRDFEKKLGIDWKALSFGKSAGGMHYGFVGGNASVFPVYTADVGELKTNMDAGAAGGTVTGGRWVMHNGGDNGLSALLEAIAAESFASVLAEPTLVALSGKTAVFKAGGEQGYTVTQPGTNTNTTEFKEWGTSIEFTPIVLAEDRITITVKPSVSTLSTTREGAVPSLTTKEASTTVELGSGQSLAIAGLLQKTKSTSAQEVPFLADLPLVGPLFRKSTLISSEKELVIIVTPYVVKPSSKRLKTPTEMAPRLYSPLESILMRKFHPKAQSGRLQKVHSAGFSVM